MRPSCLPSGFHGGEIDRRNCVVCSTGTSLVTSHLTVQEPAFSNFVLHNSFSFARIPRRIDCSAAIRSRHGATSPTFLSYVYFGDVMARYRGQ